MTSRLSGRDKGLLVAGLTFLVFAVLIAWMFEDRVLLAALVLLPLMTIGTALAGGYELRPSGRFAGCGIALALAGVLSASAMSMHPLTGSGVVIVAILFAAVAVWRALWLYRLDRRIAAAAIGAGAIFFAGFAVAFTDYRAPRYETQIRRGVKELVAYQLSHRKQSGKFEPMTSEQIVARWNDAFTTLHHRDDKTRERIVSLAVEYSPAGDRFSIRARPGGSLPFRPYNVFASWTVFRGDESGAIRGERVRTGRWCGEDAPVIARTGDLHWLVAHDDECAPDAVAMLRKLEGESALAEAFRSGTPSGRSEAIRALSDSRAPESAGILITALRDPDPQNRQSAAFSLGLRRERSAVAQLVAAIADADQSVRSAAASAVRDIHDPNALPLLVPMIDDARLPENARYQAAVTAGDVGGDAAVALLVAALKRSSGVLTSSILVGLGYTKSGKALEPLLQATNLDDAQLRDTAAFALGQLGSARAKARLRELAKSDSSSKVRETAARYAD